MKMKLKVIVDMAVKVHRNFCPGLFESVYRVALEYGFLLNFGEELMKSGITRCVNCFD
jgi:hypothetical protein